MQGQKKKEIAHLAHVKHNFCYKSTIHRLKGYDGEWYMHHKNKPSSAISDVRFITFILFRRQTG